MASLEDLDDELIFQKTLLDSLGKVSDDDTTKVEILSAISKIERQIEAAATGGENNQNDSSESSIAIVSGGSDTEVENNYNVPSAMKRRAQSPIDDRHSKRPAVDSTSSYGSRPHINAYAARVMERQRAAEKYAQERREREAADAQYAYKLSTQHGLGEQAPSWSRPAPRSSIRARGLDVHGRPSTQASQSPQPMYQTSIYQRPIHASGPLKRDPASSSRYIPSGRNSTSDIIDLTDDNVTYVSPHKALSADPSPFDNLKSEGSSRMPPTYPPPHDLAAGIAAAKRRLEDHKRNADMRHLAQAQVQAYAQANAQAHARAQAHAQANAQAQAQARSQAMYIPNYSSGHVYGPPGMLPGQMGGTSRNPPILPPSVPSIYEVQSSSKPKSYFAGMGNAIQNVYNKIPSLDQLGQVGDMLGIGGSNGLRSYSPWDDEEDIFSGTVDPAEVAADLKNLMDNIRPDEDLPIEEQDVEIEQMTVKLKPYQGTGLKWLQNMESGTNKGGILADDMGLGKTVQAIALMATNRSTERTLKTTLIIAPLALLRQWREELNTKLKRAPQYSMSVFIHHGSTKKKTHQDLRAFDVVLTTFGTLATEVRKYDKFEARRKIDPNTAKRPDEVCLFIGESCEWYRIIVDEAQNIKNRNTQSGRGACLLRAKSRFCMTGTPMMNSVEELGSLIKFLRIRPYNDWTRFNTDFVRALKSTNDELRKSAMQKLQVLLKAILLRRHKKSTVNGKPILVLPERIVEEVQPDFTVEERDFYTALESSSRTQFNKFVRAGTVGKSYAHILVMLLRLRQACCHPHLVKDFAISVAAEISQETMDDIAKTLEPSVVERIIASNGEFECPVCYDAVLNPAIFVPCGHDTCADCYVKIKEQSQNEDGGRGTRCPNCRGDIDAKQVIDYETFKKVHIPEQNPVLEEMIVEATKMVSETESDNDATETDDDDSDTEDEESEDESESESLCGFIVEDDEAEEEDAKLRKRSGKVKGKSVKKYKGSSASEEEEEDLSETADEKAKSKSRRNKGKAPMIEYERPSRVGGLVFDSDDDLDDLDLALKKLGNVVEDDYKSDDQEDKKNKHEEKEKKRSMEKSKKIDGGESSKKKKHKKSKSKKRKTKNDKGEKKDKTSEAEGEKKKKKTIKSAKTLAELKKAGQRNKGAKREYLRLIRKDFVNSSKIEKAVELIKEVIEQTDEKVILFSQWTSLLDLLEIPLSELCYEYERYDGSMSANQRADAVDEFKSTTRRPQKRIMLISLKAGNAGLNLNVASRVIIMDPFWNPYIEEQAIDRAHRLGQQREVKVHKLLVPDTVEDRIMALQEKKRALVNEALDEGAGQRLSRLSQAELGFLFGMRSMPTDGE